MIRKPAIALAAIGASLALAAPALATFPGDNGAIAFSRDGDIWTINPDGTGEKRLTSGAHLDGGPEWSPDGRQIYFTRFGADSRAHVYRMNVDGSSVTWVREGQSPELAPDGKRFAFGVDDVFVDHGDGSAPQKITDLQIGQSPSDWSPINDLILIDSHNNISWIGAASPQGGSLDFDLPSGDPDYINYSGASWSPDGTRVALSGSASAEHSFCWSVPTCSDPLVGLIVTDLGGNHRTIVQGQGEGHAPAWSPDGTRIVYVRGVESIRIVNTDGKAGRALTKGQSPDWQPLPPKPPSPPQTQTVTVTVPVQIPGPEREVEKVVTRTVQGACVIPAGKRLTLTLRATKTIRKGAVVKVRVTAKGKAAILKQRRAGLKLVSAR